MYKFVSISLGLALLSACGTAGDPDTGSFNALADEYNALAAEYGGTGLVGAAALPLAGTATYDGAMRIRVDTPARTEVLGEARIGVNFANDTVAANFGNFYGLANGGPVGPWTETLPVQSTGVIDVSQAGGQFIQTNLTGTLRSETGNVLALGALQLDGSFRDTAPSRFSAPDALVLLTGPGSIRFDGVNYPTEGGSACQTCVSVVAED